VLSEGVHSFLDLVSASLSFFTVREAGKPADDDHPFGHGKIETLSSLFESLLLLVAAGLIVNEGYDHLLHPQPVHYQGLAMATMGVSLVVSYVVYRHNSKAAHAVDSSALHVNALHFMSDVVASLGVLIGLIVLKLTGWLVVDSIVAFAVAGYILVISASQVKKALLELADTQLPGDEIKTIWKILEGVKDRAIEAHDLRTRKSGSTRHIDFHLVVCGQLTVEESHGVCDEIEYRINTVFPNASVNIHVEPCETEITGCREKCAVFQRRQVKGTTPT
jgi:cation diffusion facilitator family transporter